MAKILISALLALLLSVLVTSNALGADLVSLAYDDGSAEDGVWIDDLRGHAVVFEAPCDNWTLSELAIFGRLAPTAKSDNFVVEVWDGNLSLLSKSMDRSKSFFGDNFTWSVVDIPDIKVSGSFIVSFYEFAGVYMGADIGLASGRSILTARTPNRILPWDVQNRSYNETNWMIRALGYSPAPSIRLEILSDKASQNSPAKVLVKANDADSNLKSATLYIVDNKTGEIVWSEVKALKGGSADVQFSWPGTMFQISADGLNAGPVFAVNTLEILENLSSLLAYSAPAILDLEKNLTISATAYFGEDGKFNALLDTYGGAQYLSQDVVNRTRPGIDYAQYAKNNISLIKDKSGIGFLKMKIPSNPQEASTAMIGPVMLSGSPLRSYGLSLQKAKVGMGEYVMLVEVQDAAYNTVSKVGEKTIKVA